MEKVDEIRDNVRKEYPNIPEEDIDLHFDQQTQAIVFEKAFGHRNMNEIRGMGLVGSYGLSQGPDRSCTSRSHELHLLILLWGKPERPRRKPGKPMRKPEKPRKRTYKSWHVFNNVSSFSSPNSAYASQQSHPRSSPMMMIMMMEALIQLTLHSH